jgi:hypothetical protein
MSTFDLGATGLVSVNTILAEEANRIGKDIYSRTLHTSPWLDLTKQGAFPDGQGYTQQTLVYDRAIATKTAAGASGSAGVNWSDLGGLFGGSGQTAGDLAAAKEAGTAEDFQGGRGDGADADGSPAGTDRRSYVQFGKKLKPYSLKRAVIESPKISLEDLRFAAHRQDQLRAIMNIMTEVTRNTWENRYRDEFELISDNLVLCKTAGTVITGAREGLTLTDLDVDAATDNGTSDITANISNAILDKVYFKQVRGGAGANAYGRENGRPVFSVVLSSEASYALQTEAGFRDDIRYNNSKVSDLIAPLGVEKSFRGFYHLIDDMAPRYNFAAGTDKLARVEPYTVAAGVATPNADYETATHEAAFVLHPEVCEALIPNPMSGSNGLSFDPVNYRGKFDWKNIVSEITNPDGTIGFFRGVLASATKPIKTEFGFVIVYLRGAAAGA